MKICSDNDKIFAILFFNLDYPINLINSAINKFLRNIDNIDAAKNTRDESSTITVPLPFNQRNSVKKQMQILSVNIGVQIKPVFRFQTREIGQILALKSECARKSTFSKYGSNSHKINSAHILRLSRPWCETNHDILVWLNIDLFKENQ